MGRPKMTVNESNYFAVYKYFQRWLRLTEYRSSKEESFLQNPDKRYHAEEALNQLYRSESTDHATFIKEWVANYISEAGLNRCFNALRQSKHRTTTTSRSKRHLDLHCTTSIRLEKLAQAWGLSKQEALQQIVDKAYQELLDAEFNKTLRRNV